MGGMALETAGGLTFWRPQGVALPGWLGIGVTTRHGGRSSAPYDSLNLSLSTGDQPVDVHANRDRVRAALGIESLPLVSMSQVHGTEIHRVPGAAPREGDGLWTEARDRVLVVGIADCVPVFAWDVHGHRLGLVHSGWRGTAAGILAKLLATLVEAGSRPADLRVALGPSIGPCCYSVGADVAARFPAAAITARGATLHCDLRQANRLQALDAGLPPDAIAAAPPCTACHGETFYSHRTQGPRTGRMWALAWLRGAA